MKKIFFLASAVAASMSMMAAVEFHYLPTAGDKNAAGVEFNTKDKVTVPAGENFITGEAFEVYNAYETTYKVVGMMTDTAYSHLQIGDVTVDYTVQRIQGQDNPTAGAGNPVIDMKAPNKGACFKVKVKKDGYLYVAVKSTPNKQQFAFEGVVESNGTVAGTMVGFQYLTMSHNTGATEFGNPNGGICVEYKGSGEYNELLAPPAMPCTVLGGNYTINGVGVLCLPVHKDAETYIIGTAGSKMMACGFGFSEEKVEVKALGSKNYTDKDGNAQNFEDVVLTDQNILVVSDCSKAPIMLRAKIPAETLDTLAVWNTAVTNGTNADGSVKLKASVNMTGYVWADGVDPKFIAMSKSGDYYVLQVDNLTKFNCIFLAGKVTGWKEEEGYKGNYGQTEDIMGIEANACYQITNFDANNKDQKCKVVALDCLTGEELKEGFENIEMEGAKAVKFIGNDGKLYIRCNNVIYNALGTIIAE